MATLFVTGFPGFLASELVPRLLQRAPAHVTATCLVETQQLASARARSAALSAADPQLAGRIRIVTGDIRSPDLGVNDAALRSDVTAIFHLAAVYDLGVQRDLALEVNVRGTHHVLDFAGACPRLERLHYVSTCYVSGTAAGTFRESDLDRGQRFFNAYEETKYLAELEVQARSRAGLPVLIYRPGIVTGDSATGATSKYDGVYPILRWLLRQPRVAMLPRIGDPTRHYVNLVPRDFVVDAIAHLAAQPAGNGTVYQLCDPDPPTVAEAVRILGRATGRRIISVPLPRALLQGALRRVPGVQRLTGIPPESIDYFVHPARHTCENTTAALAGSGIRCPPLADYAPRLVAYMRRHPQPVAQAAASG